MDFDCILSQLPKQSKTKEMQIKNAKCKSEDGAAQLPFCIFNFALLSSAP
jgi:hypothetical protein